MANEQSHKPLKEGPIRKWEVFSYSAVQERTFYSYLRATTRVRCMCLILQSTFIARLKRSNRLRFSYKRATARKLIR